MIRLLSRAITIIALAFLATPVAVAANYSLMLLPPQSQVRFQLNAAFDINDSGQTAGVNVETSGSGRRRPFRWSAAGVPTQLPVPGLISNEYICQAEGINNAGITVGTARNEIDQTRLGIAAVRWSTSGQHTELAGHPEAPTNDYQNQALSINTSGHVAGFSYAVRGGSWGFYAIRWNPAGAPTILEPLSLIFSFETENFARDINDANVSVGMAVWREPQSSIREFRPVKWSADGRITALPTLSPTFERKDGSAEAINDSGFIVGESRRVLGVNSDAMRATRWAPDGSATALDTPATLPTSLPYQSVAYDINNSKIAVGKFGISPSVDDRAALWDAAGRLSDLNQLVNLPPELTLQAAYGINESGWISGLAKYSYGDFSKTTIPFVLVPIPEPSTFGFIASALVAIESGRRLRSRF